MTTGSSTKPVSTFRKYSYLKIGDYFRTHVPEDKWYIPHPNMSVCGVVKIAEHEIGQKFFNYVWQLDGNPEFGLWTVVQGKSYDVDYGLVIGEAKEFALVKELSALDSDKRWFVQSGENIFVLSATSILWWCDIFREISGDEKEEEEEEGEKGNEQL